MLDQRLLSVGDQLQFSFRQHTFTARVARGGLLHQVMHKAAPHAADEYVLHDKVFSTLTDFCETCLQSVLGEWVTRFSAFKRVHHVISGLTMAQLRDRLQTPLSLRADVPAKSAELQAALQELAAVRAERDALALQLRSITAAKYTAF